MQSIVRYGGWLRFRDRRLGIDHGWGVQLALKNSPEGPGNKNRPVLGIHRIPPTYTKPLGILSFPIPNPNHDPASRFLTASL